MTSSQGSYVDALRHRDFRMLTIAQTQSMMGDWAYSVALVVFVYAETASPGWVAASALARMLLAALTKRPTLTRSSMASRVGGQTLDPGAVGRGSLPRGEGEEVLASGLGDLTGPGGGSVLSAGRGTVARGRSVGLKQVRLRGVEMKARLPATDGRMPLSP